MKPTGNSNVRAMTAIDVLAMIWILVSVVLALVLFLSPGWEVLAVPGWAWLVAVLAGFLTAALYALEPRIRSKAKTVIKIWTTIFVGGFMLIGLSTLHWLKDPAVASVPGMASLVNLANSFVGLDRVLMVGLLIVLPPIALGKSLWDWKVARDSRSTNFL